MSLKQFQLGIQAFYFSENTDLIFLDLVRRAFSNQLDARFFLKFWGHTSKCNFGKGLMNVWKGIGTWTVQDYQVKHVGKESLLICLCLVHPANLHEQFNEAQLRHPMSIFRRPGLPLSSNQSLQKLPNCCYCSQLVGSFGLFIQQFCYHFYIFKKSLLHDTITCIHPWLSSFWLWSCCYFTAVVLCCKVLRDSWRNDLVLHGKQSFPFIHMDVCSNFVCNFKRHNYRPVPGCSTPSTIPRAYNDKTLLRYTCCNLDSLHTYKSESNDGLW